nr:G39 antigen {N-terminal} [Hirudo medicinalis=leeches, Peptide Partial, 15 aa] [Hirudo medicinalis]
QNQQLSDYEGEISLL